jgi:uncharacterized protein (DUF849 family)
VVIEAAINGGRGRDEHPGVPLAPDEAAAEASRCAAAGAAVVHLHARAGDGGWSADPAWYAAALRAIRPKHPELLVSITSIRPAGVPVDPVVGLLGALAADPATRPDLVSVNLGHITAWEPDPTAGSTAPRRRTIHFPNDYAEVVAILTACREHGIVPELGVMDLGFVANAVALRDDGLLPARPWFLLELDSPGYGAGPQVAPATVANYDVLADRLREHFPGAAWAAHGAGVATYPVVRRALATGGHVRVGLEDATLGPNGVPASGNAELVAWAAAAAASSGRHGATAVEARRIVGRTSRCG